MMEGFISLHRALLDSEIFASEKGLKIWVWLLLKASWKQRFVPINTGRGTTTITLKRGQLLFGRFKAEDEISIDGSTIYKWLKKMEVLEMINIDSSSHYTIITICNYDVYNPYIDSEVTGNEQAMNRQVTSNEQASNTNNKVNNSKEEKYIEGVLVESVEEAPQTSIPNSDSKQDNQGLTPKQPSSSSPPPVPPAPPSPPNGKKKTIEEISREYYRNQYTNGTERQKYHIKRFFNLIKDCGMVQVLQFKKPISAVALEKYAEKYGWDLIESKLKAIENKAGVTKTNIDLSLTLNNWMEREHKLLPKSAPMAPVKVNLD